MDNSVDNSRALEAVRVLIRYLGDDPDREGLALTPNRVLRFYDDLRVQQVSASPTTFETMTDDLVVTSKIPFASLCEHHMLPFYGEAAVAYLPKGKLLGLSKTARAIQQCAAGLTIQEHLTHRAALLVSAWAETPDVAVVTTAMHSCMIVRGVKALGARTSSSSMLGAFRKPGEIRTELFAIIGGAHLL